MNQILSKFIKTCPKTGRVRGFKKTSGIAKLLFPLIGIAALIWVLVRVIPKPSRAQYPCMKVAAPIAGGFLTYLGGLLAAIFAFKKGYNYIGRSKYILATLLITVAISISLFINFRSQSDLNAEGLATDSVFVPTDPPNTPIGTAIGIHPGRVVWVRNPGATKWNGSTSSAWWSDANTNQDTVSSMLSKAILSIGGQNTLALSWDAIFKYFNTTHGRGNVGYTKGEKIAIKINLNWSSTSQISNDCPINSPQMIYSLLKQLVNEVGVQPADITLYDLIRYVPDAIYNKCNTAFPGIHYMGWDAGPGREQYVRDTTQVHWSQKLTLETESDPANGSAKGGNPAYLAKSVVQATYMINLACMKGHRFAGVSLCAKSHVGSLSVDNDLGQPYVYAPHAAGIHAYYSVHYVPASLTWGIPFEERRMGTYNTLVDLMGHKDLGGKTVLYLLDGLYAVEHEQAAISLKSRWLSAPFNKSWAAMMLVSQDLVAIESVGLDFYRTEAAVNSNFIYTYGFVDNYLHEAAQADNPPSGTVYAPSGTRLKSLGVHEHWNNSINKQYSRNLGTGNGIELVQLTGKVTSVQSENTISTGYSLSQNYPNPFNPTTVINYSIPKQSNVRIVVYDGLGREVATLLNEYKPAGNYTVQFNAGKLAGGVYLYRIKAGDFVQTKKLILLK